MAEKELKAVICAMLPYGLRGTVEIEAFNGHYDIYDGSPEYDSVPVDVELTGVNVDTDEIEVKPLDDKYLDTLAEYNYTLDDFVPYLRPLSSMTEEEKAEYTLYVFEQPCLQKDKNPNLGSVPTCVDWLNANHFNYWLPQWMFVEAPQGMYNK